jgi:hypothetical protein
LMFSTDGSSGLVPMVFLLSESTFEPVPIVVALDADTGQLQVTAEIAHFSTVVVTKGNIQLAIANPGDQPLAKPFDVSVTVTRTDENLNLIPYVRDNLAFGEFMTKLTELLLVPETYGPLTVQPGQVSDTGSQLNPTLVRAPDAATTIGDAPLVLAARFTCAFGGRTSVSFSSNVSQELGLTNILGLTFTDQPLRTFVSVRSQPFHCVAPTRTPTPGPTPTPPPAPTPTPFDFEAFMQQLIGTYDVVRVFDTNDCDYGSYTGVGTIDNLVGSDSITFDIVNNAPLLSHMEYVGKVIESGALIVQENDPAFYNAILSGSFEGKTFRFTEDLTMLRDDSPCKGQEFTTHGTAVKRP